MTTAVFDTLKAARQLENAGMETKQAEAIIHMMTLAFEDTVATKADKRAEIAAIRADIEKLEASTKAEIAEVRAELKQDITNVKADLIAELAGLKADFKMVKYIFAPAVIILLLKIAFFS